MMPSPPLSTAHLFPAIDDKLMELLYSLTNDEWSAQTIASKWKVKDVVAHLLDGNIRALSLQRDRFFGVSPGNVNSFAELTSWLNELNWDWVKAARRISPSVLIQLHEATRKDVSSYFASLDPFDKSVFPVDWAGEKESRNWLHVAREYTEKWMHQQQIRDAVDKPGILTREFYYPVLSTFMYALPHTYREVKAKDGTTIEVTITSEAGGQWFIEMGKNGWQMVEKNNTEPAAVIILDPDTSWKLFTKSWRYEQVKDKARITGDQSLGRVALDMVSVMA